MEHFAGLQSGKVQRSLEDTAGIPTGVAFDIQRQIELRRAKQAVRPDKFSAETPIRQIVQVNVVAAPDNPPPLPPPIPPDNMVKDAPDDQV